MCPTYCSSMIFWFLLDFSGLDEVFKLDSNVV